MSDTPKKVPVTVRQCLLTPLRHKLLILVSAALVPAKKSRYPMNGNVSAHSSSSVCLGEEKLNLLHRRRVGNTCRDLITVLPDHFTARSLYCLVTILFGHYTA